MTVGGFCSSLGANLPRQFLELKLGKESLGIYSTVATPAVIVQVAASYIFNPVLTEFAWLYQQGEKRNFKTCWENQFSFSIIVAGINCGKYSFGKMGVEFALWEVHWRVFIFIIASYYFYMLKCIRMVFVESFDYITGIKETFDN